MSLCALTATPTDTPTLTPTPTATLGAAQSVTIDYDYDPLYRLTNAVYSGDITTTIGYSYDEVGNPLTQTLDGAVTNYDYDNANRLVQVTSPTSQVTNFGWDNNGNLLSDGVNTYTYDQANRLVSVMRCNHRRNQSPVTSFAYNGLGDRLRQTVGGAPTNYVNDYAAGLTQVLADGTNTYLYGAGRIGQYNTAMQYFGADGLGSVRQLYNSAGIAQLNQRYDPFGNVMSATGAGSVYGFTGEATDATGLVFLRARYLDPIQGRFTTRDTWKGNYNSPLTLNRWNYTRANPVNWTDPSGYDPNSVGLIAFALCFDLHSLTHGTSGVMTADGHLGKITAQQAVDICKAAYSPGNWGTGDSWFDDFHLKPDLPQSPNDLMGWYVNNYRGSYDSDRLYYDGNQPLTREVAESALVQQVRAMAYDVGDTKEPTQLQFSYWEQIQAASDALVPHATNSTLKGSLPIDIFIGSFYYQIRLLDGGRRIGFRIDNDTTLESGTHIAGRFKPEYDKNVEDLIDPINGDPSLANKPLYQLINDPNNHLISILRNRTRDDEKGGTLGGANLYQTFTWTERRPDECEANLWRWGFFWALDIQVWNGYESLTRDPY